MWHNQNHPENQTPPKQNEIRDTGTWGNRFPHNHGRRIPIPLPESRNLLLQSSKMSCRTTLNAFTTNSTSTSIAAVSRSSVLLSNITLNSFPTVGTRRGGGAASITTSHLLYYYSLRRLDSKTQLLRRPNKKLRRNIVAYATFLELPLLPFPSDQVSRFLCYFAMIVHIVNPTLKVSNSFQVWSLYLIWNADIFLMYFRC